MLNIYPDTLAMAKDASELADVIAARDSDLARQLRRACTSVPLNVAEGGYSLGKNRRARYCTALGSARETLACVEVADAMGAVKLTDAFVKRARRVIGALVNVTRD